jgi:hypothetical protein
LHPHRNLELVRRRAADEIDLDEAARHLRSTGSSLSPEEWRAYFAWMSVSPPFGLQPPLDLTRSPTLDGPQYSLAHRGRCVFGISAN